MSDELASGLAASANEPSHDTQPVTVDAALDAAFTSPAEGSEPSDPSTQTEPVNDANAGAIVQPQATAAPKTAVEGAPPHDKWEHVLANARTKAREEALAEFRDPKTGRDLLSVAKALGNDLSGTLIQLIKETVEHPQGDPIVSQIASILSARGKQAKQESEPEPDLQTADGALVYSAEQARKWQDWNTRQIERKFGEQFKPLMDLQQQFEGLKRRAADEQQAISIATERGEQWKQMPFFEDHRQAILERQSQLYADMEAQGKQGGRFDPVNAPWVALQQAYREVVTAQALPKLQAKQTEALVADAARKRAGSASDPAAAAPAQPRKPRTVDEALDQVFSAAV